MLQSVDSASLASTPSPQGVKCPACGTENTVASRFCRQCGQALTAASAPHTAPASNGAAAAPANGAPAPAKKAVVSTPEDDGTMDTHGHSVSEEIDARRAKQLLDRALHLGERNEIQAAILACRQAIALAPASPGGYSMLGMLLERANDVRGAIHAYEKVLQLAPHSALERDSLVRLYDKLEQNPALKKAPTALPPELLPAIEAAAPGLSAASVPTPTEDKDRRKEDRRQVSVPVAVERRRKADRRSKTQGMAAATVSAATAAAPLVAKPAPAPVPPVQPRKTAPAPVSPLLSSPLFADDLDQQKLSPLQSVVRYPSFYWRGLPLVVTAVLSLGFIAWARGYAVGNTTTPIVEPVPQTGTTSQQPVTQPQPAPVDEGANPRPQGAVVPAPKNPNPDVVISNRPGQTAQATNTGTTNRSGTARPASQPSLPSPNRPLPSIQTIAPAPIPSGPSTVPNTGPGEQVSSNTTRPATSEQPATVGGNSGGGSGALGDLPRPRVNAAPPADEPVRVLPQDTSPIGGASSAGAPVNPAGAPGRGYIRITQGRIPASAPVRPNNAARNDEGRAATAARGGQSDSAINSLSSAIRNSDPNDLGFRYQQRASLFLERGDYNRAVDDFQSAINAYNDQIGRGEQVRQAQAGIRASRAGINLAASSARRGG